MMKFLLTMNMPSGQGNPVHQVTIEYKSKDLNEFYEVLEDNDWIIAHHFYSRSSHDGIKTWEDRGLICINTAHIGKAQVWQDWGPPGSSR